MIFTRQDKQQNITLMLQSEKIEQVESMKYLGVWLDRRLNFQQQVEYAVGKATKASWKVNRLIEDRKGLTPKTGILLYKTLIRPCWEFSVAAWADMPEKGLIGL